MNNLGWAKTLDSFLKAYKNSKTKKSFTHEWFKDPRKLQNSERPPYEASLSKLRRCNLLEAEYMEYVILMNNEMTTEQAPSKLKLSKPLPAGVAKNQHLQKLSEQEQMNSFRDFLRCCNMKSVVRALEAMQRLIPFYHNQTFDMLKTGYPLPNLADNCLHKSIDANFYHFTGRDRDLLQNIK